MALIRLFLNCDPTCKRRGSTGACFLDARKFLKNGIFCTEICQREQISCARSVPHTKVCGFQTLRHDGFKFYLIVSVFLLLLLSFSIVSADMNSTNYKTKSSVTSNTGGNSSSSNFISRFIMGIISGNIISETYKNFVGFFHSTVTDIVFPVINFTNPTPANGSTLSGNSVFVNVSASDDSYISSFIDFDNSLVSWWRMDDLNSSGGVGEEF